MGKLRVHVEHCFQPDPRAVRRAIEALIRLSDEARARPRTPETDNTKEAS